MRHRWSLIGGLVCLLALLLTACGTPPAAGTTSASTATPAMAGMGHDAMPDAGGDSPAGGAGQPYDAAFIDSMILHHEGAIAMANQALTTAERPEIKQLAGAIISAQQAEIAQLQSWRAAWYPDLAKTAGMEMAMGPMAVAEGPAPFEQRFIEAMIPHHESAIAMSRDALQKAERAEIKGLAQAIIAAQEGEIAQMRAWMKQWYGIEP